MNSNVDSQAGCSRRRAQYPDPSCQGSILDIKKHLVYMDKVRPPPNHNL